MCPSVRLLIYLFATVVTTSNGQDDPDGWTPNQLIPEDYARQKLPPPIEGQVQPLIVSISTKIIQLIGINEAEQSYTIDIMYQQKWPDNRLTFPAQSGSVHGNETVPLDLQFRSKLWVPDVYIINAMSPGVVLPTPLYMEIEVNSSLIVLTSRQVVKLRCSMDLYNFPQDTQSCDIEFALCKYFCSKCTNAQIIDRLQSI